MPDDPTTSVPRPPRSGSGDDRTAPPRRPSRARTTAKRLFSNAVLATLMVTGMWIATIQLLQVGKTGPTVATLTALVFGLVIWLVITGRPKIAAVLAAIAAIVYFLYALVGSITMPNINLDGGPIAWAVAIIMVLGGLVATFAIGLGAWARWGRSAR